MSLDLDQRQCAMLEEMGVRVWQPAAPLLTQVHAKAQPPAALPKNIPELRPQPTPVAQRIPNPGPATSSPPSQPTFGEIATMDWPALQQAVAGLLGVGSQQARWMVVGELPSEAEESQGQVFVGEEGLLLDNMLKALGLSRSGTGAQAAYLTHALKSRFPGRAPARQDLVQHEVVLRRQVALLQPGVILALGKLAAQALLHETLQGVDGIPLGKLRAQVHHYQGVPVVVSFAPGYLLRNPQDKARAWADLCLAHEAAASH